MAAEAEAAREARAKVIAAEGEQKASGALKNAAEMITQSPHALQLRYLQTLTGISTGSKCNFVEISLVLKVERVEIKDVRLPLQLQR